MGSFSPKPISIDVSSNLPILQTPGVQIGLPTVEIYQSAMTLDIGVHSDTIPLDETTGQTVSFGKFHLGETTMALTDGVVEIAPH